MKLLERTVHGVVNCVHVALLNFNCDVVSLSEMMHMRNMCVCMCVLEGLHRCTFVYVSFGVLDIVLVYFYFFE